MRRFWFSVLLLFVLAGMLSGTGPLVNGAGKTVELNIFIDQPQFREIYANYFNQFIKKYKTQTGTTVKVNFETPAAINSQQILQSRFASGDAPDVFFIHPTNTGPQYNRSGYLEDLSKQPFVKTLYANVKSIISLDGKVKCMPLESVWWGYDYNKDIFEKVGITPALTLSAMKANVEKLKAAGYTPFLLAYNEDWVPQLFNSLLVGALNETKYKGFVSRMNKGTTSFAELKEYFDIIDLVNANGNTNAMDITASGGAAEFALGKHAMWVQGPWMAEEILKANPKFNLAVAPLPISEDPKQTMINISVSKGLSVYSKSKNKKVAFALLNYMLDKKDSNALYQNLKFNPVSTVHTFQYYPWVESALSYVKKGMGYEDPLMPNTVKQEVGRQLQLYYVKKATRADIVKALDKAWKDGLAN
ncbi:carbohydrate ABC transporter substrate-binding protein (CUT1 family) [Hydrogenispora ethanolica]|jgi:raffinose/stachyose/melibiose transport system substrate-binding protein|uniref:Carbohydrate ABC transporter substrate-binding protein (CUT1 family) n=1 Tax=Hydrogenispora ethanolica TaxID=1082276 RepID=A0A4R1RBC8_HYDET|nr:extracellular solute-binding protein [Hydrogenispora ethanolica]TCL63046.1 carbohydrate ABC transporter substrate-binding protein (CUT1 family) [Hydrogenispora ethanolica]